MNVNLTEEQNKLIDKIARDNGFSEYDLITESGSEKGDNFLGILTTVTIKNGKKQLELILKAAHQSEAFRKAAPLRVAYVREIFMYQTIFEEFKKFEEEYNVPDPFNSYVKMYDGSTREGHECLAMENLKVKGFKLWEKKVPMNAEHISTVLKEYAKFHATSIALKHKHPEIFNNLIKDITTSAFQDGLDDEENNLKFEMFIKAVCSNAYKAFEGDPVLIGLLEKFESVMKNFVYNGFKDPEYKQVIVHGDCWCNNFLFKYDDNNNIQPSLLRIIDWQITFLSSPAYDFVYFFLAHSPKEILDDYKTYLNLYYDTFSKHLRHFDCDPDELFPYSTMEKHIGKFMAFGLSMCLMVLKLMLADSDEAPDFQTISENGDLMEGMDFSVGNMDAYKNRIKNILIFLEDNKFDTY